MLNTTFKTYKEKFGEIITIFKPLIIIGLVVNILGLILTYLSDTHDIMLRDIISIVLLGLVLLTLFIIQGLIYTPATFRTIQKRELGGSATIQESVTFQKKNIGNYFMLMVWMLIYGIGYALLSFGPIVLSFMLGSLFISNGPLGFLAGIVIIFAGIGFGFYMIYKNYSKIFFVMNIYLTKNLEAQECMKESIRLGEKERNKIWGYIGGVIAVALVGFVLTIIPMLFNYKTIFTDVEPSITFSTIASIWQFFVNMLFILPMTYIYMSKAYVELTKSESSSVPVEAAVLPVVSEIVQ